jgi:hypothetical protein
MEIAASFLILMIFAAVFLMDLPLLLHSPDRNKNLAVYITILFLGFLLSALQVLSILTFP